MNKLWERYQQLTYEISAYKLVVGTTGFDADTIAPKKNAEYRNKRLAFMRGEIFAKETSGEMYDLLCQLNKCDDLTFKQKQIVKWHLKRLENMRAMPKELVMENSLALMQGNQAWLKAKATNDYASFKPYLIKIVEMKKKMMAYRTDGLTGYDACLADYEPDMNEAKYDEFFNLCKEKLVPLIKEISKQEQADNSFVYKHYPKEQQKQVCLEIMKYIDFDFEAGLIAESEHPYSSSMAKNDNRYTNHYYENNLLSAAFSTIHECGHLNYNHSVADDLAETFVFNNMSSGMHESQSRLFENYLGRNYHFWDNLFVKIKEIFPEQLKDVDQKQFYLAANRVEPSLVRIQADELTYPLHIIIRYEIEKSFFDGTCDFDNLEQVWADKYEKYLGVRPTNAAEGLLQDMHWGNGLIGYFPTYALGSAYAAQFVYAMRQEIDVEECLATNNFAKCKEWLKEHIHQYGGLYSPAEQMKIATNEAFNPNYYVDYLIDKFKEIYNLK